jgi:hypothetical protein
LRIGMKVYVARRPLPSKKALHFCWTYCLLADGSWTRKVFPWTLHCKKKLFFFIRISFFSTEKAEKAEKRDRLFSRGWDAWVVEIHIRYELCWNFYIAMGTLKYEWVGGRIYFYKWVMSKWKTRQNKLAIQIEIHQRD